jgi:DNA-binding response OmpR family regulator
MKSNQQNITLNVLLADDDIDDRFFFSNALDEISIKSNLISVQDGEELMNYLYENTENLPDILFLDLSMPRKTGFECLSEIRENLKFNKMPIIMLSTSYSQDLNYEQSIVKLLYNIGAQDFIRKPSDFAQLKAVISDSLTKVIEKHIFDPTRKNAQ